MNTKTHKRQKGFTLIELLIVIGIIGVLAAVAIPMYYRLFNTGESETNAAELTLVQKAMDAMMTDNRIKTVEEFPSPGTSVFEEYPKGDGAEVLANGPDGFLRSGGTTEKPTKCMYSWTADGRVNQESCP